MRYIIYGAGGIGGTIAARLHLAGLPVVCIARGDHLNALSRDGLSFVSPRIDASSSGGGGEGGGGGGVVPSLTQNVRLEVFSHPREVSIQSDDVVLLCMKSQHTASALEDLANCAPADVSVVCAQNGVANERMALRRFANTYAMVVFLPAVFLKPGEIITHAQSPGGILDVGRFPQGVDTVARTIATDFTRAGFTCRADGLVMRQKYAKLLANLNNAVQAAVANGERTASIARALKHEALACYAAAGIECASGEETRARRKEGIRMVEIEGVARSGGSSWQSVMRGTGDIEADYLNGEIVQLGRLFGVATPVNALCQQLARRIVNEQLPAGHFTDAEFAPVLSENRTADG